MLDYEDDSDRLLIDLAHDFEHLQSPVALLCVKALPGAGLDELIEEPTSRSLSARLVRKTPSRMALRAVWRRSCPTSGPSNESAGGDGLRAFLVPWRAIAVTTCSGDASVAGGSFGMVVVSRLNPKTGRRSLACADLIADDVCGLLRHDRGAVSAVVPCLPPRPGYQPSR